MRTFATSSHIRLHRVDDRGVLFCIEVFFYIEKFLKNVRMFLECGNFRWRSFHFCEEWWQIYRGFFQCLQGRRLSIVTISCAHFGKLMHTLSNTLNWMNLSIQLLTNITIGGIYNVEQQPAGFPFFSCLFSDNETKGGLWMHITCKIFRYKFRQNIVCFLTQLDMRQMKL